jgi:protoporphyrinogen oxidase
MSARGTGPTAESAGIAVLGGGPAGLTAAYLLGSRGARAELFESDQVVGGLARTVKRDGYRFDLGGHRFFTKIEPVQRLWEEMLGDDFLTRPRLSRIYYRGGFLAYPLRAADVVSRLGVLEALLCTASYLRARIGRQSRPETFEDWVTSRFGRRLYDAFFRSYTEKVWGIPGSEIRSEWAAQRIRDLSLRTALLAVLGLGRSRPTTLIEEFRYPRLGPGQMWEAFARAADERGVPTRFGARAAELHHDGRRVRAVTLESDEGASTVEVDGVVSTIPLADLVLALRPEPPAAVLEAARSLRYRDLCLVALIVDDASPFPDNWIYLHDPGTRAARVQNFGAWSEAMVRPGTTCLGVEYFCFRGDDVWSLSEDEAVALATEELGRIGLVDRARVRGGARIHVPRAYPMYDGAYGDAVATIRDYLARFENLQPCGRNGLHRYNNQDHSMWTATLAVLNLLDGAGHDVWSVNTEQVYLEDDDPVMTALELPAPRPRQQPDRAGTPPFPVAQPQQR